MSTTRWPVASVVDEVTAGAETVALSTTGLRAGSGTTIGAGIVVTTGFTITVSLLVTVSVITVLTVTFSFCGRLLTVTVVLGAVGSMPMEVVDRPSVTTCT